MNRALKRMNVLRWIRFAVFNTILRYEKKSLAPIPMLLIPGGSKASAFGSVFGWIYRLSISVWPDSGYIWGRKKVSTRIDAHLRDVEFLGDADRLASVADFARVFDPLQLPRPTSMLASTSQADAWFEWSRVAGINPNALRLLDDPELLRWFDLAPSSTCPVGSMQGEPMSKLLGDKRLFYVDHVLLDGLTQAQLPNGRAKFAPPTMGLFLANARGVLEAIAIHLPHGQSREPLAKGAYDVYYAKKDPAWEMARAYFEIAEVNVHEVATHLTYTHFGLEAVIIAAKRSFPDHHAIGALLDQHLRNVAFNNYEGRMLLINPGGFASELLVGGREGTVELIKRAYVGMPASSANPVASPPFAFETWDLPLELASRGVGSSSTLTEYPYRDDGLALYALIGAYVDAFVDTTYPDRSKDLDDRRVSSFLFELANANYAALPGAEAFFQSLPDDRARLKVALTRILWASGPFHAAVNYPQYDHVAYVPAMPSAAMVPPMKKAHAMAPDAIRAFLVDEVFPDSHATLLQLQTVALLTQYRFDRLGGYDDDFLEILDDAQDAVVARFRASLDALERTIEAANRGRRFEYRYLRPSQVPNAASI